MNPRNDAVDITDKLRALIESQAQDFQLLHQTSGDGTHGPIIYSSSIEIFYQ